MIFVGTVGCQSLHIFQEEELETKICALHRSECGKRVTLEIENTALEEKIERCLHVLYVFLHCV